MKNFLQRISFKITIVISVISMLMSSVIYYSLSSYVLDKSYQDKMLDVKDEIFSLQETLSFLVANKEKEQIQKTISFFGTHTHLEKVMLMNANNKVISSSRVMDVNTLLSDVFKNQKYNLFLERINQTKSSKKINVWYSENNSSLYAIAPIITADLSTQLMGQTNIQILYVEYNMQQGVFASRQWFKNLFITIVFVLIISALFLALYIHFSISRRIIKVQKALENFNIQTKPIAIKISGKDEINSVSNAFNVMANKLYHQNIHLFQYKAMVSLSSDRQALLDEDFVYLAVNNAYAEKFNLTTEQIIGKHPSDLFGKAFFDSALKENGKRCLNGEIIKQNKWFRFSNNEMLCMEISLSPYVQEDGNIHGIMINARDITELKQYQDDLEQSNNLLNNVINSTPDLIFSKGSNLKYILVNNAFAQSIQETTSNIIGKTDKQLNLPIEKVYEFTSQDNIVLKGKPYIVSECTSFDNNKTIHETSKFPLKKENGEIIGIVGIARDITSHIANLAKISKQQKELSQVIDAMFDAVITINDLGLIQSCNNATEQMFGYTIEELIGKNVSILTGEAIAKEHDQYIKNYVLTGKAKVIGKGREVVGKKKDHKSFPLHLTIAELPQIEGERKRFVGVCRDLSNIKQHEKLLNRTQKMEALGQLTGGIAHDYNNVLGVIIGYSDILKAQLKEQPTLLNFVDQINQAGNRGAQLTRKLLSFSRQTPDSSHEVSINEIIKHNKDVLRKTLLSVELKLNLNEDISKVNIDKNSFEDVLLNMAINAMHAMPQGGVLTLSTCEVNLSTEQASSFKIHQGKYVQLAIEDNGIGMSKEIQEKIFEPFFSTKGERGSGLGLAQVYGFMKSSKGAINVYSELGEGTRFSFYFPISPETETETETETENQKLSIQGNETILVVDDEPQLRTLAQEVLMAKGYHVLTAINGIDALDVLAKNPIDLMFSDIIMPKMNGIILVEQVQKLYPNLKIILASGFQGDQGDQANNKITFDEDVITKPYDNNFLLSRIRQCLDKQFYIKTLDENQNLKLSTPKNQLIKWTSSMSIDDGGMLDDDHKGLFSLLNRCQALLSITDFQKPLQKIISELLKYTHEHFAREELAMALCNYPYAKNHTKVHQMISKKLVGKLATSSKEEILSWLTTEMTDWLIDHIMVMDKPLHKYLIVNKTLIEQAFNNSNQDDINHD